MVLARERIDAVVALVLLECTATFSKNTNTEVFRTSLACGDNDRLETPS
jgi:hypothetical protein